MREPMPTPVQPFIVNARDYDSPDYIKGAVMRLEGKIGRPPGLKDEEGNELPPMGLLGDVATIKQRLGRPPQAHGIDDPGDGVIAHVYEQRRRSRRSNAAALTAAALALLTSLAAAAQRYASGPPPTGPVQSAPAPAR